MIKSLSDREIQVLVALADGSGQKEVGAKLHISVQTVKNHCSEAYRKLGVNTLVEAYVKLGWLMIPDTYIENRIVHLKT